MAVTKRSAPKKADRKKSTRKPNAAAKAPAQKQTRAYGPEAEQSVERAMHEMEQGELMSGRPGKAVTSPKQAVAIGLSKARRAGAKVPRKAARKR